MPIGKPFVARRGCIYDVVGIPRAAGALLPSFGLERSPVFASAAMSLSSVSVGIHPRPL